MALFMDKLRISNILVRGSVPREQAEEFAEAISETIAPAVTESELEREIDARTEPQRLSLEALEAQTDAKFAALIAEQRADFRELRAEIRGLRAEMDVRFAQTDTRFAQLEAKIYRAIALATALIIAAMSAWAAFG